MSGIMLALAGGQPWKLAPLTPEYRESEHGSYVKAIGQALEDAKIRNIALSGNYGVGKSSILQKVAELHRCRVVEISLSTLAPIQEASLDGSVPPQATTATNRIQQEIVKQLLYREEPHKTPGSRFKRIERFGWGRELATAFFVGFLFAVVFLLTGWTGEIASELAPLINLGLWAHLIVLSSAAGFTVAVRHLLHGRIYIRQLSAGSAAVTLDNKSITYFDQYLDEIVYFFEVSRRDIVIFEDIDRFNDSHIFETLRSLNTLLNASPQTNKPIRFIYAIRDSIFDLDGLEQGRRSLKQDRLGIEDPAQAEAVRANRTKFFDLVIPVVPFITHRSARNLTAQLLQDIEHEIDEHLIDLASQYVPDMRLLKNVRNEFIVFRDRIFSGDGEQLALSESELFAMMLYKSTHLADFEAIRIGKSRLDELYDVGRRLVRTNIKNIEGEVRTIRQRLAHLDSATTESLRLGDQLIALVRLTVCAARFNWHQGSYSFNGVGKHEADLRNTEFWIDFVQESGDPVLRWSNPYGNQMSFSRSDLVSAMGVSPEPERWSKTDREELKAALAEHFENLRFLRSADMDDLIRRPEFLTEHNESERSLDTIARQLLTKGLAYQLVRAGYINRNFTLYTSTFHGDRVSSAATNFIIHHVQRGVMDEHFELKSDDVEAVVRECSREALGEPALYNIAILDHLLRTDADAAGIMIRSLVRFGDDQRRFLQAYLSSGSECVRFVERFTMITPRALMYLVNQVELDERARLEFVSVALVSLADDVEYRIDSAVIAYLQAHYAELPALISTSLGAPGARRIARVFSEADIQVPALEPLSETARQAFVANDLYTINRENLVIALGCDTCLALDTTREASAGVYKYVMQNLNAYLAAVDGTSVTVASMTHFVTIIEEVLAEAPEQLNEVIARASEGCVVTDLADVSEGAWSLLARNKRFPATFSNISRYISSSGALDADLARVLAAVGAISEHVGAEEDDKQQLAQAILATREHLPSASLRAELVLSLELGDWLVVGMVAPENGELFALLLKYDIISDDADTYAHLLETDWPTRERVIHMSSHFKDYITPELVRGDLAALLRSKKVALTIKSTIVDNASEYVEGGSKEDLVQLARFAIQRERQLTLDVVEQLASSRVPPQDVIVLLQPHLQTISSNQLFDILQSLGGDYSRLTSAGRDRPKIPNNPENRALLEVLKRHGTVSSYSLDANFINVNKRHKIDYDRV